MTYSGAFAYLHDGDFTLIQSSGGGHDQGATGARVAVTRTQTTIRGALDALTEEDLRLVGQTVIKEGTWQFHTEESYGVKVGDLIKDASGKLYRVLQRMPSSPLVRERMDPTADMVGFYVESTRQGAST